ncbi:MAG: MerC domain-containing protein [Pseudomonadales bacterium]
MKDAPSMVDAPPTAVAWADLSAATLATLCLLHCVALPLIIPLLPLAGQLAGNESVHHFLVWLAVPVSLSVLLTTIVRQPRGPIARLAATLLAGLGMLLCALTEPLAAYELALTVGGSLTLAVAHLWHWQQLRLPARVLAVNAR